MSESRGNVASRYSKERNQMTAITFKKMPRCVHPIERFALEFANHIAESFDQCAAAAENAIEAWNERMDGLPYNLDTARADLAEQALFFLHINSGELFELLAQNERAKGRVEKSIEAIHTLIDCVGLGGTIQVETDGQMIRIASGPFI
jgi:hypothetical protein